MSMQPRFKNHRRMARLSLLSWTAMALTGVLSGCTWDHVQPDVCFESEVLPIIRNYCATSGCHDPGTREEGYDFSAYAGIRSAVRPGHPGNSELIEVMRENGEDKMPPAGYPQPSAEQIAAIEAWIKSGAANTTGCSAVTCDTSAAVTYSGDIQPMIATYCGGCHGGSSPSAGINLNDFATVKANAQSGALQGSISGDPNYISMPPNSALLPSCYVTKIEQWLADGTPDN